MRLGILFSGGKDSTYACYLAQKAGHKISCLITIVSENPESYMFHTPSISKTTKQAEVMKIPIIIQKTKGKKELELKDLEAAIKKAKQKYKIQGIVTGAVASVYQASRIQKICDNLNLECYNPLWQIDQIQLLKKLIKDKFELIIAGVFAFPLDKSWLGRKINREFIKDVTKLQQYYKINPAGEGGEFESLVLNCPMFKYPMKINKEKSKIFGEKNSWKMEVELEQNV